MNNLPNKAPAPNRHPRIPLGGWGESEYLICARPPAPEAIGEAQSWASRFISTPTMNSKLIPVLTFVVLFWTSGVYSDPKPLDRSSGEKAKQEDKRKGDDDLVHRMVQIARDRYSAGNLQAAHTILRAALEIEPRNNEAWYYMNLLDETVRKKREQQNTVRPWYPTLPPRPVHE